MQRSFLIVCRQVIEMQSIHEEKPANDQRCSKSGEQANLQDIALHKVFALLDRLLRLLVCELLFVPLWDIEVECWDDEAARE